MFCVCDQHLRINSSREKGLIQLACFWAIQGRAVLWRIEHAHIMATRKMGERYRGMTGKIQPKGHMPSVLHPPAKTQLPKFLVPLKIAPPTKRAGFNTGTQGEQFIFRHSIIPLPQVFTIDFQFSSIVISVELLETSFMAQITVLLDDYVMSFWNKYAFCCLVLCAFILDHSGLWHCLIFYIFNDFDKFTYLVSFWETLYILLVFVPLILKLLWGRIRIKKITLTEMN